ncbi:SRR1 family protein [Aspergillus stella-maris]|uniref:SRR1 family protein n=1 Tax=Aspergillus stella-maris TaxID=1810926 RepID=UPI003CCDC8D6
MPHTRRKKPSHQNKRLTITDDSGWSHVTTTGNARRINRKPSAKSNVTPNSNQDNSAEDPDLEPALLEPLLPAEAPPKTTLPALQRQLALYRDRWEESVTWQCVIEGLKRGVSALSLRLARSRAASLSQQLSELQLKDRSEGQGNKEDILDDGTGDEDVVTDTDDSDVSIVCVGLGSPSGFLRGGWVDRRQVSMYQLAVLVSVMEWVGKNTPSQSSGIKTFAQDPVFNTHDESLLASLNISVLKHPSAFTHINKKTILFAPGAERRHLEILLRHDPAIIIGGPLEDIESTVVKGWMEKREELKLKEFEELETAFWGMSVYFPRAEEVDGEKEEG